MQNDTPPPAGSAAQPEEEGRPDQPGQTADHAGSGHHSSGDQGAAGPRSADGTPWRPGAGPTPPPPGNRFFSWMRSLELPRQPGWLGGVASGIALRLRIDPIIVRGILVVVGLLGAPVLILYAAAWLLLPDHTGRIHAEELGRGRFDPALAGIAIVALLGLWPGNAASLAFGGPFFIWDVFDGGGFNLWRLLWTLLLIAGAVWLVVAIVRSSGSKSARAGTTPPYGSAPYGSASSTSAAGPTPEGAAATGTTDGSGVGTTPTALQFAAPADPANGGTIDPGTVDPGVVDPTAATASTEILPPEGATPDELAAWHATQARFKKERDEFVRNEGWRVQREAAAARAAESQLQRERQAAEYRAERERTRSKPLYTLAAIGVALLTGAAVLLTVGRGELPTDAVIAGLASMLGVLGLAIVVNGIIGRRSGGSSGMAWVVAGVLVVVSVLSIGARVTFVGSRSYEPMFRANSDVTYLVGAGQSELDLSDYWDGIRSMDDQWQYGQVRLFSGAGEIDVTLPEDTWVTIDIGLGAGEVIIDDAASGTRSGWSGSFEVLPDGFDPDTFFESDEFERGEVSPPRQMHVSIRSGAGDVTITTEGELR